MAEQALRTWSNESQLFKPGVRTHDQKSPEQAGNETREAGPSTKEHAVVGQHVAVEPRDDLVSAAVCEPESDGLGAGAGIVRIDRHLQTRSAPVDAVDEGHDCSSDRVNESKPVGKKAIPPCGRVNSRSVRAPVFLLHACTLPTERRETHEIEQNPFPGAKPCTF